MLLGRGRGAQFAARYKAQAGARFKRGSAGLCALALCAIALCATSGCLSARYEFDHWREIRTDHLRIRTNLGAERGTELAREIELFRAVANLLLQLEGGSDRVPTRFYLFRSQPSYEVFQLDRGVVGYFMQPLDGNVLVANVGAEHVQPTEVLFHEYAHLLLRNQSASFPVWFDEGFAELLSTVELRGQAVHFGRPPRRRVEDLRAPPPARECWVPLERLIAVRALADLDSDEVRCFYAQSWLAMHFLYLGHLSDPAIPDYAGAVRDYLERVDQGTPALDAWTAAFGLEPAALNAPLREYLGAAERGVLRYAADQFRFSDRVEVRPMDPADALVGMGEVLVSLGRDRSARHLLQRALALGGESARALGALARASGEPSESEEFYARALRVDPRDGVLYGWRAMEMVHDLEAEAAGALDRERVGVARELAERCVSLRPDLPLCHVTLGRALHLAGHRPERVAPALERAHALLPSHPRVTLWLGELYASMGKRARALRLLRKVEQLAHAEELSAEAAERIAALDPAAAPGEEVALAEAPRTPSEAAPPEPRSEPSAEWARTAESQPATAGEPEDVAEVGSGPLATAESQPDPAISPGAREPEAAALAAVPPTRGSPEAPPPDPAPEFVLLDAASPPPIPRPRPALH